MVQNYSALYIRSTVSLVRCHAGYPGLESTLDPAFINHFQPLCRLVLFFSHISAVKWLKYCRYGVKHFSINHAIYISFDCFCIVKRFAKPFYWFLSINVDIFSPSKWNGSSLTIFFAFPRYQIPWLSCYNLLIFTPILLKTVFSRWLFLLWSSCHPCMLYWVAALNLTAAMDLRIS